MLFSGESHSMKKPMYHSDDDCLTRYRRGRPDETAEPLHALGAAMSFSLHVGRHRRGASDVRAFGKVTV
jgi:hypothetical protein